MESNLRNSIDELHQHIIDTSETILSQLVQTSNLNASVSEELLIYVDQLKRLVPEVSKPKWIEDLLQFKGKYLSSQYHGNSASQFASMLHMVSPIIRNPILSPDEALFSFDNSFEEVRDSIGVPETFESLVQKLEEIIAADLIDSRLVQEAIERLTILFRRNKHGSLTSILMAMHYGRFALKAFSGALEANKYLKPLVQSFKEEFSVAEEKVKQSEELLKEEAIKRLTNESRLKSFLLQTKKDPSTLKGFIDLEDDNHITD